MRRTLARPSGVERRFGEHELIVTKTDPKGIITYANSVFLRVSGYSEHEVMGEPHNIIRHPDMPRAVFKLLWDTISSGEEIFAYVMNLASDGSHYWVFAHVTPSFSDGRIVGYHSNRRSPDPRPVTAAASLYQRLLAEERRHERSQQALDASSRLLHEFLAERGQSYPEYVWSITPEER